MIPYRIYLAGIEMKWIFRLISSIASFIRQPADVILFEKNDYEWPSMTINDFQLEKGFRFNKSLNHLNNYPLSIL